MESFESKAAAQRFRDEADIQTQGRSVMEAVDAYLDSMRDRCRESTVKTVAFRLRALLALDTHGADALWLLTPARAADLYRKRTETAKADTHRGELANARTFGTWCVEQKWLRANPFAGVKPTGRKAAGKPQLRIDEARRFLAVVAAEDTREALAVHLTLALGLRASETTDRVVRDVDDGGRVFWIDQAKTKAGRRALAIPADLVDAMAALVRGRAAGEPLWGDVDRHWLHYHVTRFCRLAGVPRVTPHGLRGLFATLSIDGGMHADAVARHMGHTSAAVTRRHYIADGHEENARIRTVAGVLAGSSQPSSQAGRPGDRDKLTN